MAGKTVVRLKDRHDKIVVHDAAGKKLLKLRVCSETGKYVIDDHATGRIFEEVRNG